jgi:nucleolar protein 14
MEQARRDDQAKRDQAAAAKRHKAYAWLEQQQGEINNQVRQGGGLLQGGGTGAARGKARTGKLGIKKGGKL